MSTAATRKATYADLEAVPEHLVAEIIGGDLLTRRMPAPVASSVILHLRCELAGGGYASAERRLALINKPELHVGGHVIVPSLAAWPTIQIRQALNLGWRDVPLPFWIAEVVECDSVGYEFETKRDIYAEAGIAFFWHLDPTLKTLDVFRTESRCWRHVERFLAHDIVRAPPFDAIAFPLGHLWPLDDEPAAT